MRPVMKETDAAKRWCPFSQKDRNCVVRLCMSWHDAGIKDEINTGYCILIKQEEHKCFEEAKSAKPRAGTEVIGGRNEYKESGGGIDPTGE